MDTIEDSIKEINNVFSFFQDPMEKIEQLIDYGKMASGISEDLKIDENKIIGCTSMAWVICKNNNDMLYACSFYCFARLSFPFFYFSMFF